MTVRCPYCRGEVRVEGWRLTAHPAMKGKTPRCIGSGEPVEAVADLNRAHQATRAKVARLTGRRP